MLSITASYSIPENEIEIAFIRAQGAGGQNVNKVSSAVHLRYDIVNSSLPEHLKERVLLKKDSRMSKDGVMVIKAQQFRTQEKNREDALARLQQFIQDAIRVNKTRHATKPTYSSQRKRVDSKVKRGSIKAMRRKPDAD